MCSGCHFLIGELRNMKTFCCQMFNVFFSLFLLKGEGRIEKIYIFTLVNSMNILKERNPNRNAGTNVWSFEVKN